MSPQLGRRLGIQTGGPDLDVEIDDAGTRFVLRFRRGRLDAINPTRVDRTDIRLRSHNPGLIATLCGDHPLPVEYIEAAVHGLEFRPIHPFDCGPQPTTTTPAPGVDLIVQYAIYDSPVGHCHYTDVFEDGILVARTLGVIRHPDVIVRRNYADMIWSLTPGLPVLDGARGASVSAKNPGAMMILAAIYDQTELRAHLNQRRTVSQQLCFLAAHTRHPNWLGLR